MDLDVGKPVEPPVTFRPGYEECRPGIDRSAIGATFDDDSLDLYSEFMVEKSLKQCSSHRFQSLIEPARHGNGNGSGEISKVSAIRPPDEDSNLDLYTETLREELQERHDSHMEVSERCEAAEARLLVVDQELKASKEATEKLQKENAVIQSNMASLLLTARTELKRKDDVIRRLRLTALKRSSNTSHHTEYLRLNEFRNRNNTGKISTDCMDSSTAKPPQSSARLTGKISTDCMDSSAAKPPQSSARLTGKIMTDCMDSSAAKPPQPSARLEVDDASTGAKRKRSEDVRDRSPKRSRVHDSRTTTSGRNSRHRSPPGQRPSLPPQRKNDRHVKPTSDTHCKIADDVKSCRESGKSSRHRSRSRHTSGTSDSGKKNCDKDYGVLDLRDILKQKKRSKNKSGQISARHSEEIRNRCNPAEKYRRKTDNSRHSKMRNRSREENDSVKKSSSPLKSTSSSIMKMDGYSPTRIGVQTNLNHSQSTERTCEVRLRSKPGNCHTEVTNMEAGGEAVTSEQNCFRDAAMHDTLSVIRDTPEKAASELVCDTGRSSTISASSIVSGNQLKTAMCVKSLTYETTDAEVDSYTTATKSPVLEEVLNLSKSGAAHSFNSVASSVREAPRPDSVKTDTNIVKEMSSRSNSINSAMDSVREVSRPIDSVKRVADSVRDTSGPTDSIKSDTNTNNVTEISGPTDSVKGVTDNVRQISGPDSVKSVKDSVIDMSGPTDSVKSVTDNVRQISGPDSVKSVKDSVIDMSGPTDSVKSVTDSVRQISGPTDSVKSVKDSVIDMSGPTDSVKSVKDSVIDRSGPTDSVKSVTDSVRQISGPDSIKSVADSVIDMSGPTDSVKSVMDSVRQISGPDSVKSVKDSVIDMSGATDSVKSVTESVREMSGPDSVKSVMDSVRQISGPTDSVKSVKDSVIDMSGATDSVKSVTESVREMSGPDSVKSVTDSVSGPTDTIKSDTNTTKLTEISGVTDSIKRVSHSVIEMSGPTDSIKSATDSVVDMSGPTDSIKCVAHSVIEMSGPTDSIKSVADSVVDMSGPTDSVKSFTDSVRQMSGPTDARKGSVGDASGPTAAVKRRRIKPTLICGMKNLTVTEEKTYDIFHSVIHNIVARENSSFANAKVVHIYTSPDNDSGDSNVGCFSDTSGRTSTEPSASAAARPTRTPDNPSSSVSVAEDAGDRCHDGSSEHSQISTDLKQHPDTTPMCHLGIALDNDRSEDRPCDRSSHESVGKESVFDNDSRLVPTNAACDGSLDRGTVQYGMEENEHLLLCTVNHHPDTNSMYMSMSMTSDSKPESTDSCISEADSPSGLILKEEVCSRTIPYLYKTKRLKELFSPPNSRDSIGGETISLSGHEMKTSIDHPAGDCFSTDEEQVNVAFELDAREVNQPHNVLMPSKATTLNNTPILSKPNLSDNSNMFENVSEIDTGDEQHPSDGHVDGGACSPGSELSSSTGNTSVVHPHHHSHTVPVLPVIDARLHGHDRPYDLQTFEFTSFPTYYANVLTEEGELSKRPKVSDLSESDLDNKEFNNSLQMSVFDHTAIKSEVSVIKEAGLCCPDIEMDEVVDNEDENVLVIANLHDDSETESEHMDQGLPYSNIPKTIHTKDNSCSQTKPVESCPMGVSNFILSLTDSASEPELIPERTVHDAAVHEADVHQAVHEADVHEADIHEADVHEADVHEADVHEADVHEADVHEADVHEAVHEADVHEADVHEADVHEADVHEAAIHEAVPEADVHDADTHEAVVHDADVHEADVHEADFREADVHGAVVHDADVHEVDVHEVDVHEADVHEAVVHVTATCKRSSDTLESRSEKGGSSAISFLGTMPSDVVSAVEEPAKLNHVVPRNEAEPLTQIKCKEKRAISRQESLPARDCFACEDLSHSPLRKRNNSEPRRDFSPDVLFNLGVNKRCGNQEVIDAYQPVDLTLKAGTIGQSLTANSVLQVSSDVCGFTVSQDGALDLSRKANPGPGIKARETLPEDIQGTLCSGSSKLVIRHTSDDRVITGSKYSRHPNAKPLSSPSSIFSSCSSLANKPLWSVPVLQDKETRSVTESTNIPKGQIMSETGTARDNSTYPMNSVNRLAATVEVDELINIHSSSSSGFPAIASVVKSEGVNVVQVRADCEGGPDTPGEPGSVSISTMDKNNCVLDAPSINASSSAASREPIFEQDQLSPAFHSEVASGNLQSRVDPFEGVSDSLNSSPAEPSPVVSPAIGSIGGFCRLPRVSGQSSNGENGSEFDDGSGNMCVSDGDCIDTDVQEQGLSGTMPGMFPDRNFETLRNDLAVSDDDSKEGIYDENMFQAESSSKIANNTVMFKLPTSALASVSQSPGKIGHTSPELLVRESFPAFEEHSSLSLHADGCDFDQDFEDMSIQGSRAPSCVRPPHVQNPAERTEPDEDGKLCLKHARQEQSKKMDDSIEDGEVTSDDVDAAVHSDESSDLGELLMAKRVIEEKIKGMKEGHEPLSSKNGRDGHRSERQRPARRHDHAAGRRTKDYRPREDRRMMPSSTDREVHAVHALGSRTRHRHEKDEPRHGHHGQSTRRIPLDSRKDRRRVSPPSASLRGSCRDHSKENHSRSDCDRFDKYSGGTSRRHGVRSERVHSRRDSHSRRSSRDSRS